MVGRWLAGSKALGRRILPLTMGVVVAFFVASTIYTQLLLDSDVDVVDIAANSAPSIAELANARAELRDLGREADRAVAATDPAVAAAARAAYAQHRHVVDVALVEYRKTPDYTGEHELFARVPVELEQLDLLVADGVGAPALERSAARRRVEAAIDQLESSMRQVSELNRSHLVSSAQTIVTVGRRRNLYAFVFDVVGILIAFVATVLATRTVERYMATLSRRTRELEHLAIQVGHEIATPLTPIDVALRLCEEQPDGDEHRRTVLARARRSLNRIEESIGRLSTFAQAGMAPKEPLPRTLLAPLLEAAARTAGVNATADPSWHVGCAEPALRDLLADFFVASVPPGGAPLAGVDVRASANHVRVTLLCAPGQPWAGDPFDPQLHNPASVHPGIDLRLATVRRRVETYGGTVGVHRNKHQQRLWIELPRA